MRAPFYLDRDEIARACQARGVTRLALFGSATTDEFDSLLSDVDFLVEFAPHAEDAFGSYFGLKEDLEKILGRPVDLVMANAVHNPHFAAAASRGAEEVYAA